MILLGVGVVVVLLIQAELLRRFRAMRRQMDFLDLEVQALRVRVRVLTDSPAEAARVEVAAGDAGVGAPEAAAPNAGRGGPPPIIGPGG